ncbi:hypothetical protein ACKWTF_006988 [Chironomus riparius]
MFWNKLNTCCCILLFSTQLFSEIRSKHQENFNEGARFKSLKCEADNKTIFVKYCFLKPVSRKVVTLNTGLKFLVPYNRPFLFQAILYYRYGTIFREIIDTKKHDICEAFDGGNPNLLVKLIFDMINSRSPGILHKCPYIGDWDLRNFTANTDLLDRATMLFPRGIYRFDFYFYSHDVNTLNTSTMLESKTSLKETFG